jgi:hypothetical protein
MYSATRPLMLLISNFPQVLPPDTSFFQGCEIDNRG